MSKKVSQDAVLFFCFRLLNKNELQTIPDGTFRNLNDLRLVYVSDLKQARSDCRIDLFHNSSQIKYYYFSNANKPRNDEQISKEYINIYIYILFLIFIFYLFIFLNEGSRSKWSLFMKAVYATSRASNNETFNCMSPLLYF